MPKYKIADIVVDMTQRYPDKAHWYAEYLTDEPLTFEKTLIYRDENINYLVTEGVDITEAIAENMLLCNVFNRLLLRYNGCYLHSSAIMYGGKVYLVSGHSGVGKSTLTKRWCRLYPDSIIINDDKPSFRIIDGKCIIYGTPFAGGTDNQCNMCGELGGIVFLEQAEEDKLVKLTSAQSITELLQQTLKSLTVKEKDRLLSLFGTVIENYPIYKLYCTNSDNAARTVIKIAD